MGSFLDELYALEPLQPPLDVSSWWDRMQTSDGEPFDRAARVAYGSDRLAWVFAGGYHGALCAAFGVIPNRHTALCVTEDGGNTPDAIESQWNDGRLFGVKSFVTMGDSADDFIVLASRGERGGRKHLVLVRADWHNAHVEQSVHTPFAPELTHSRLVFEGTTAQLIRDDAWPLIKSFRLVEDVYILGATLAWFTALSIAASDSSRIAAFSALLLSARELAAQPAASAATHVAYDGVHRLSMAAFAKFPWSAVPEPVARMWERDAPLLDVAGAARQRRTEIARVALIP